MRIALVDDSQRDLSSLASQLERYASEKGVRFDLKAFSGGEALLRDYRPGDFDLIFLDIFMDGMTGIETARRIRGVDDDTCIVFLTTSDEHQAEAIHLHVYDYLNKGEDVATLWDVMDRILRGRRARPVKSLTFVSHRVSCSLPYDEITYISADRNYLAIHDSQGRAHRTRMTFSAVESLLSQDVRFLTILRGIIVNMDHIVNVTKNTCILKGNICLPVNVKNSGRIERCWANYTFEKIRNEGSEGTV